jgi:glycosyltransferase involved in cell wall biosynthesis
VKISIVADWLPTYGGAEHVVAAFHHIWPDAPLSTTVAAPARLGPLAKANIRTDRFLQNLFHLIKRHQYLLPFMPKAMERIDCTGFDIILSSSHAVGKGIIPPAGSVHVCYCHTPMRYAWEMEEEYIKDFRLPWPLSSIARRQLKRIRRWDLTTAKRVDSFIANSTETKERIKRIYGRESTVISPPVDDKFFHTPLGAHNPSAYLLAVGRLVPYKRFDLLIEMANKLSLPLKIGGTGSDMARLQKIAGPTVEFLGFVPDEKMPELYAGASFLLFPQIEDAGIVPLEAQACGLPVIALAKGGALDSVQEGVTGILVREQTALAFTEALQKAKAILWHPKAIREASRRFSKVKFQEQISLHVQAAFTKYQPQ